ncbi:hypothetical protein [Mycobacterium intracellulare]|uniref:Uncharacterized protein n=1 Tax=Mycobacterium intracellulare TaxID=1767 RepID=A0A7R7MQS6_MYCIT|nr:hypothetical protein MINTM018_05690 [Mycobacterium intracellulare]
MKIREMIARSLLVGSLAGAALGLGAGVAAADPPPPPPLPATPAAGVVTADAGPRTVGSSSPAGGGRAATAALNMPQRQGDAMVDAPVPRPGAAVIRADSGTGA